MATNANAIITQEQVAIEDVKRLMNIVIGLKNDVFIEGVDYGVIPGTGDKPTLLQPGMEKLLRALHLRAEYVERSKIEDFDKGLFFYRYECRLIDWETNICLGTAIGSANSYESKWRWRDGKRKCPNCGKETINRSKFPPKGAPQGTEPGWYCYAKIGGCGSEFGAKDPAILSQTIGRVENPDIFDQMNTCDKIGQKRSLGSAVKTVANVSMIYNIDLEDFAPYSVSAGRGDVIEGDFIVVETAKTLEQPSARVSGAGIPATKQPAEPKQENTDMRQRPDETEVDPNLYHCDRLIVTELRGKPKAFKATIVKSGTAIPLSAADIDGKLINGVEAASLKESIYPLEPSWSVYADRGNDGAWVIERIDAGVPQPEATA